MRPPSAESLSNAELQVLLRNVPELRSSRDENTIDKVVAVFGKARGIDDQDFQEFEEDGFSAFVDEDVALQDEIRHACRCAQRFIQTLALACPAFGVAGNVRSHMHSQHVYYTY